MHRLPLIALATETFPRLPPRPVPLLGDRHRILVLEPHLEGCLRHRMPPAFAARPELLLLLVRLLPFDRPLRQRPPVRSRVLVHRHVPEDLFLPLPPVVGRPVPLPAPLHHGRRIDAIPLQMPCDRTCRPGPFVGGIQRPSPDGPRHGRIVSALCIPASLPGDNLFLANGGDRRLLLLVEFALGLLPQGRRLGLSDELLFLRLERGELRVHVGVDVVRHVHAVDNLGDGVVFPVVVGQVVDIAVVRRPDARAAVLPHEVARCLFGGAGHGRVDGLRVLVGGRVPDAGPLRLPIGLRSECPGSLGRCDAVGNKGGALRPVPGAGVEDLQAVEHVVHLAGGDPAGDARGEEPVARRGLHVRHALFGHVGHGHERAVGRGVDAGVHQRLALRIERLPGLHVHLVDHDEELLVHEERPDGPEEGALRLHRVPAVLRNVHEVEHRARQVGEGRDGLHLDGVPLLQWMVEEAGRVDHLPAQIAVVGVSHVQTLGGERVRLHVHVRARHLVHEARFAHVGRAAHQ
mmetsp:Transcript_14126/g.28156  ORF Transcript_14126/g.28156 Transcript_14126/m.28156 type:complete len:518 (-) Transcript_14126:837-2390(-)